MKVVHLKVAGAFHSELMKPADDQLAAVLAQTPIVSPRIPVYSNVDATSHYDPDDIRRTLVAQVLQGVRWEDSMCRMLADGFDTFYEIGPGSASSPDCSNGSTVKFPAPTFRRKDRMWRG